MKLVTPEDDEDEEEAPSQTSPPQEDSPPKSQEDLNGKSEVNIGRLSREKGIHLRRLMIKQSYFVTCHVHIVVHIQHNTVASG